VSIWAIERFLNDYAFAHGAVEAGVVPPNGLRVAVVGSNPGGLACADELARRGYAVTVFDSELLPGGLQIHGLPAFKLEKSIAQRRIDLLRWRGVKFCMGVTFDRDITLAALQTEFDAVFLALGARRARPLVVPGADRAGVVQALPFIIQKNSSTPLDMPAIGVADRRVVVLGGGDTAMDCVRTAIRSGARDAVCVYRRDAENMPCSRRDYADAMEEGARFILQAAPVAVLGREGDAVSGLRLIRTAPGTMMGDGHRAFPAVPGTEFDLPADWIILALGFEREPFPRAGSFHQLATDASGSVQVDAHQMTNLPGVFAAGDIVRGPGTALEAVRDARKAAAGIHDYLAARWPGGGEMAGG
jgi:glutamate synthase (NADPH/NADH) small chain